MAGRRPGTSNPGQRECVLPGENRLGEDQPRGFRTRRMVTAIAFEEKGFQRKARMPHQASPALTPASLMMRFSTVTMPAVPLSR